MLSTTDTGLAPQVTYLPRRHCFAVWQPDSTRTATAATTPIDLAIPDTGGSVTVRTVEAQLVDPRRVELEAALAPSAGLPESASARGVAGGSGPPGTPAPLRRDSCIAAGVTPPGGVRGAQHGRVQRVDRARCRRCPTHQPAHAGQSWRQCVHFHPAAVSGARCVLDSDRRRSRGWRNSRRRDGVGQDSASHLAHDCGSLAG